MPDLGGAEHSESNVAVAEPPVKATPAAEPKETPSAEAESAPPDPFAELDEIAGIRKRDEKGKFEAKDKPKEEAKEEPEQEAAPETTESAEESDEAFLESSAYKRSKPLRDAYDKLRDSYSSLEKQLEELKQKTESGEVTNALADENASLKARIKEYQAKQIVSDYETSDEYQEKYIQPIKSLIDMATSEIEGVEIETAEGTRMAKKQDFLSLIEMPLKEASRYANMLFGDAAPQILAMRTQIRTLNEQRKKALADAEKNSAEVSKKRLAEQAEQQRLNQQVWTKADEKIVTRYPDLFGKIDGDEDHNKLLEKGLKDFDEAISPESPMTSDRRLTVMAGMRRYAAAFPATVRKLRLYEDKVEELEAELKKLRSNDPDGGGRGATKAAAKKSVSFADDPDAPWNRR